MVCSLTTNNKLLKHKRDREEKKCVFWSLSYLRECSLRVTVKPLFLFGVRTLYVSLLSLSFRFILQSLFLIFFFLFLLSCYFSFSCFFLFFLVCVNAQTICIVGINKRTVNETFLRTRRCCSGTKQNKLRSTVTNSYSYVMCYDLAEKFAKQICLHSSTENEF